jgi:rod shape-determining protein MreD
MVFYLATAAVGVLALLLETTVLARYLPPHLKADWLLLITVFVAALRPTAPATVVAIFLGALSGTVSSAPFGTHIVYYWASGWVVRSVDRRLEIDTPIRMAMILSLLGFVEGLILARPVVGWRVFLLPDIILVASQALVLGLGGWLAYYLFIRFSPIEGLGGQR